MISSTYPLTAVADPRVWCKDAKFLGNKRDWQCYANAQAVLTSSVDITGGDGLQKVGKRTQRSITKYPTSALRNIANGSVQVRAVQALSRTVHELSCERGLFALRDFQPGEWIVPYEGELLDWQGFTEKYLPAFVEQCVWLTSRNFCKDLRPGKDSSDVQLRGEAAKLYGCSGQLSGEHRGALSEVRLNGCGSHRADHMLGYVAGLEHKYIDAALVPSVDRDGDEIRYLLGVGALVNSADAEFSDNKQQANVQFEVCPQLGQAGVVVRQDCSVRQGEEFLASYLPESIVVVPPEQWREKFHDSARC